MVLGKKYEGPPVCFFQKTWKINEVKNGGKKNPKTIIPPYQKNKNFQAERKKNHYS